MCAFVAGDQDVVWKALGALRLHVGKELGMVPETDGAGAGSTGPWNFLWVTRFPMFEWDAEPNDGSDPRWVSCITPSPPRRTGTCLVIRATWSPGPTTW